MSGKPHDKPEGEAVRSRDSFPHDFNTKMGTVLSNLGMIISALPPEHTLRIKAEKARRAAIEAHGIVMSAVGRTTEQRKAFREEQPPQRRISGQVLVVEDDEDFSAVLGETLDRMGMEASVCADAACALALLTDDPGMWALAIVDRGLPDMTGDELVTAMKAFRPDLPCLICTGGSMDEIGAADAAIGKPFQIEEFAGAVEELLGKTDRREDG